MHRGLWNQSKFNLNLLCTQCKNCKSLITIPNRDKIDVLIKCNKNGIIDTWITECTDFKEDMEPQPSLDYFGE